ncbi:MAG: hypothetical protein S4CHLAM102_00610 [Chlamydiia bacterium]|nr:hypothetical protein [Chlamydiia bacterium]
MAAVYNPADARANPLFAAQDEDARSDDVVDPYGTPTLSSIIQEAIGDTEEFIANASCRFIPLPSASYFCLRMDQIFEGNPDCKTYGIPPQIFSFTFLVAKTATSGLETIQAIAMLPLALAWVGVGMGISIVSNLLVEGKAFTGDVCPKFLFNMFYEEALNQDKVRNEAPLLFPTLLEVGNELCNEWADLPYKYSPVPVALSYLSKVQEFRDQNWMDNQCIPECAVNFTMNALRLTLVAVATIQFIATLPIASLYVAEKVIVDHVQYLAEHHTFPSCDQMADYFAIRPREYFNEIFQNSLNISPIPNPQYV